MKVDITAVAERLKTLGYTVNNSDDTLIQFAINSTEQYIKNFCAITSIPDELYYVWLDMAAGNLLNTKSSLGFPVCDNIDFDAEKVQSISEGDVSVTYNNSGENSKAVKYAALLSKLCDRDSELVTFRKLRW